MTGPASLLPSDAAEMAFPLDAGADLYSIHRALEGRFGGRQANPYLWALARGPAGDVCIVRRVGGFVPPVLAAGERWLFRLHARIGQKDRRSGERRSWRRGESARRLQWLDRRGGVHGFIVISAVVETVREPVRKPGAEFWLDRSEFSGLIEIVEPARVAAAMIQGVGGGRAWGLGMLRLVGKQEE